MKIGVLSILSNLLRIGLALLWPVCSLLAQPSEPNYRVNRNGRIVQGVFGKEVQGFGVNYTIPFAHAYRTAERMGVDPKTVIEQDVYHFARLGFDLYRVHVWDVEISDAQGNLMENEHLDTFDYLLHELGKRGIRYILTPIAYWGNGWPEPDRDLPGFSSVYGKANCLTQPDCIEAQQNYLIHFMNHVNPYTGKAYKDDPNLIAVEISNEPHHRGEGSEVTEFVAKMVGAVKKSGCEKPIFYNVSHGVHFAEDYFRAGIDGGTFQWYPTGLGYQQELTGNVLPQVDRYPIPFDSVIRSNSGAKIVYEFDAADVMDAYVYPAMARSFREAGIQLATHFTYDPSHLAPFNTEYNTHYMNLAYTPSKALALMISAEVFRELPLYRSYGRYPNNTKFGHTYICEEQELAHFDNGELYIHTNTTRIPPTHPKRLKRIAGVGDSPVVIRYFGTGAYFLDQIERGVWRLEVMPDPILLRDPFGKNNLKRQLAGVQWNEEVMEFHLDDLGTNFSIRPINRGNDTQPKAWHEPNSFKLYPGAYLLVAEGRSFDGKTSDRLGNIRLDEFHAPLPNIQGTTLRHVSRTSAPSGKDLSIRADLIAEQEPDSVWVTAYAPGNKQIQLPMKWNRRYHYQATLPGDSLREAGTLRYFITTIGTDGTARTYPEAAKGRPGQWDFDFDRHYRTELFPADAPLILFDAARDYDKLIRPWRPGVGLQMDPSTGGGFLQVELEGLWMPDSENRNAEPIEDYTLRHPLPSGLGDWKKLLNDRSELVVYGSSLNGRSCKVQIGLTLNDGSTFGYVIELMPHLAEYHIPLSEFEPVPTVLLPRPYPGFLPYYFRPDAVPAFDLRLLESLQISLGPGLNEQEIKRENGYSIGRILIE